MSQAKKFVGAIQISSGETASDPIDARHSLACGLYLPTLDAATLTLEVSADGVNWQEAYVDGEQQTLTVVDGCVAIPRGVTEMASYVRVVSDAVGGETADRTIPFVELSDR